MLGKSVAVGISTTEVRCFSFLCRQALQPEGSVRPGSGGLSPFCVEPAKAAHPLVRKRVVGRRRRRERARQCGFCRRRRSSKHRSWGDARARFGVESREGRTANEEKREAQVLIIRAPGKKREGGCSSSSISRWNTVRIWKGKRGWGGRLFFFGTVLSDATSRFFALPSFSPCFTTDFTMSSRPGPASKRETYICPSGFDLGASLATLGPGHPRAWPQVVIMRMRCTL